MGKNTDQNQATNELLSLKVDAVLKLYFARKENEEQLRQFLKAAIKLSDVNLETVDIKNPILTKQHVQDKDFIVDIHLTSATGELVIIEIQCQDHSGFVDRMVAYNARDYSSQLRKGEKYTKLKSAITVVVVNFNLHKDTDEFYERIFYRRNNRKIFTKAQQFIIIDLTKLPNELTEPLHLWGRLFKVETEEELRMLMQESQEMREAGAKLLELSADKEAQEIAEARKDAIWARNHMIECLREETETRVREETEIRVREEVREETETRVHEERDKAETEKLESAKNMLADGFPPSTVAKYIKLSIEEIKALKIDD